MNRRAGRQLLTVVFVCFFCLGSWRVLEAVAGGGPQDVMTESVGKILDILNDENMRKPEMRVERRRRVEAVVDESYDFREMSRHTLAGHWDKRSAEEKDRFVELFSELVKSRYVGKINHYSDQTIRFVKEIVRGKKAEVRSLLMHEGMEIPLAYRLYDNGDNWKVYDMKIENVSLAVNYRSDFDSIIKKEGYDGLIVKMQDKLQELRKEDKEDKND